MKAHIALNNQVMLKGEDGFYQLEKDTLAVKEFQKEVDSKLMKFEDPISRMVWLIENDYYINFFEYYSKDDILDITNLIYSYEFEFKSYMAISKFYQSYALKTNDKKKYLERYEDRIITVSLYLSTYNGGDIELAKQMAVSMIEQRYQPATPTFQNSGKKRGGELVSCFLLEMDDSLNSIMHNVNVSAQLSKIGGGVALNLSKLRSRNEPIKGVENASSGIIPVTKLLEDVFSYVNQLGQRAGAGAAYLNIFHWDILEFLDTKKINASEKSRLQTLAIGLIVPDKFVELAKKNEDMYIFAPYSVFKEYEKHLDDMNMNEMYDQLVSNPRIKKKAINPRSLLNNIARTQFESGFPYMVFIDNANNKHPLNDIGKVKMSNLCTEIFQLQETSVIGDYNEDDIINRDICCNLGSLNIANVMELKNIEESVKTAMESLTAVSQLSNIENAPGVKKANKELNAVGLGALNLHGYLAKNKITYESDFAKEFVRTFFMIVNFYSIKASMEIAKSKKQTFLGFKESDYYNGKYFEKYISNEYMPTTDKVKSLFDGIYIPTKYDWKELYELVRLNGMFHAYRMAIAPTQSIGYIQNATPSIAPIVDLIERRTYGDSTTYYPMPFLSKRNAFFYKSAYKMDMMKVIDLVAEIQPHIDQGISTILYVDSNTTTSDLARYYMYAHHKGLKSLYYTRTKNLSIAECESCSV